MNRFGASGEVRGWAAKRLAPLLVAVSLLLEPTPAISGGLPDGVPVGPELASRLGVPSGEPVRVERLQLEANRTVSVDLEPFTVWAQDAVIEVTGGVEVRRLPIPEERYFRGRVAGEPDSLVFVAVGRKSSGFVQIGGRTWTLSTVAATAAGGREASIVASRWEGQAIGAGSGAALGCDQEMLITPMAEPRPTSSRVWQLPATEATWTSGYSARVAVETDYEFLGLFSYDTALATEFVGRLFAASSAIYARDVKVRLELGNVFLWSSTAPPYPWAGYSTRSSLLYGMGDWYHSNRAGVTRSIAHLLSGKNLGGGVAWLNVVCRGDFLCSGGNCCPPGPPGQLCEADGHYGGGYGLSSSLSSSFGTADFAWNMWDLFCVSHEIGHNFSSPHTQCYSPAVDTCCDCSTGLCAGAVPPEKGTIMSYCHIRPGGYGNIRLIFGKSGEASAAVLTQIRNYVEGGASGSCLTTTPPPTAYFSLAPCRVFDTRNGLPAVDAASPALAALEARVLSTTGRCGIPSTARAMSVNLTAVNAAVPGSIVVYPGNEPAPIAALLNFPPSAAKASSAIVRLAPDGSLGVANQATGVVHFILDVNGWFE
jgi:hypothetical protein